MRQELQDELYKKYPKIFVQRKLDCGVTCMCWGIECEDGWYKVIDELCNALQTYTDYVTYCDKDGEHKPPQVEASQVKEKYGQLRFYTNGADDKQDGMIYMAECMADRVCEICGSTTGVKNRQHCGWLQTTCLACEIEKHGIGGEDGETEDIPDASN